MVYFPRFFKVFLLFFFSGAKTKIIKPLYFNNKKTMPHSKSNMTSPSYRSLLRFLLRTIWLQFLYKIFGDNLNYSYSATTTSSTDDFDILSRQTQQLLSGDTA